MPNVLACPRSGCDRTFGCEACLSDHLETCVDLRYTDVFGEIRDGWTSFCTGHADRMPVTI